MNIVFEWPAQKDDLVLDRRLGAENAMALDINRGTFGPHDPLSAADVLVFYWLQSRLMLVNNSRQHLCRIDGEDVPFGVIQPLRHKARVQVGNLRFMAVSSDGGQWEIPDFYRLLCGDAPFSSTQELSDVVDILPHGGDFGNDSRYVNEVVLAQADSQDVLKRLEIEYKHFLIWQEQNESYFAGMQSQEQHIFKTDSRFDAVREEVKNKTLTECIIGKSFLMEKVWPELETADTQDDFLYEEKPEDILRALAPDNISSKVNKKVPELVFQDFYKVGLDSHY